MLFNAHIYDSNLKSADDSPYRMFGAIVPDAALTGVLQWDDLHSVSAIRAFSASLPKSLEAAALARGLLHHEQLDEKSHTSYEGGTGYAYARQTPALLSLVKTACSVRDAQATRLAHNFIEAGVDYNLLRDNPGMQRRHCSHLHKVDIALVASWISDYFGTDATATAHGLRTYVRLATVYDLGRLEEWMALLSEVVQLLLGHVPSTTALRQALQLAADSTGADYKSLFAKK